MFGAADLHKNSGVAKEDSDERYQSTHNDYKNIRWFLIILNGITASRSKSVLQKYKLTVKHGIGMRVPEKNITL